MLIRCFWPACDFRGKSWGAAPVDAFWVEATREEAEISIFPRLNPAALAESKKLAKKHSHLAAMEDPSRPYCFLVARDLSSIDPFQFHYPFHQLWNAYSPFELIGPFMITSLGELGNLQLPKPRPAQLGAEDLSGNEPMGQISTGKSSENRITQKLECLGLLVRKPIPDRGVDLEAWFPENPSRIARIQVKGRNPKHVKTLCWFQLRVSQAQVDKALSKSGSVGTAWREKLARADFIVLDATKIGETWVFSLEQAVELIRLNDMRYGHLRGSLTGRQKEMNLDIVVGGTDLKEIFSGCLENFQPIKKFLGVSSD